MNIVATTTTAISPANAPTRVCSRVLAGARAAGHVRRDVAGPGHRERAAGLAVPAALAG